MSVWDELLLFARIRRERCCGEENDDGGRRIAHFNNANFGRLPRRFEEGRRRRAMKISMSPSTRARYLY
jgi:hypothetical protein